MCEYSLICFRLKVTITDVLKMLTSTTLRSDATCLWKILKAKVSNKWINGGWSIQMMSWRSSRNQWLSKSQARDRIFFSIVLRSTKCQGSLLRYMLHLDFYCYEDFTSFTLFTSWRKLVLYIWIILSGKLFKGLHYVFLLNKERSQRKVKLVFLFLLVRHV